MKIDHEEARRIAALAQLKLDGPALEAMAREMTAILSYIDQLAEVDVAGFEEHATAATPLRTDEPHPPLDPAGVEANAPEWRDGLFVVPKVIGGE